MKYLLRKLKKSNPLLIALLSLAASKGARAQDSYVGDGFGGRSWYQPSNFSVGGDVASLNINAQVYVWGQDNGNGPSYFPAPVNFMDEQGITATASTGLPYYVWFQPVSTLNNVKLISMNGTDGSGAVKTDGSGWVWGTYSPFTNTPQIVIPDNCKFVNADGETISFIKNDGTVWTVGKNTYGEFGDGSAPTAVAADPSLVPVKMNITNAVRVAAFATYTFRDYGIAVLRDDGTVWVTGETDAILSSDGAPAKTNNPIQVPGLSNIVDIKCAASGVVALTASGDVYLVSRGQTKKLTFPTGAKPIVAIKAQGKTFGFYCLDEGHILYSASSDVTYPNSLQPYSTDGAVAAYYADDISFGLSNKATGTVSYLVRTSDYPADDRIWMGGGTAIFKMNDQTMFQTNGQVVYNRHPGWGTNVVSGWWPVRLPGGSGGGGGTDNTAGTIDCAKTQIYPAPVAGTASQLDLIVTVNVTTAGCFTPLTVSGSGFSISSGFTQKCVTTTGIQQLHIPVNYDGSTLGTLSFTIGQAGACTADLTKVPKDKLVKLWTLDNCTLMNAGPVLK